jgi:hypothetical protein
MKKIKQLINTFYRVCLVKPDGRKGYVNYEKEAEPEPGLITDSLLREIIANDLVHLEADPNMREMLLQRVKTNGQPAEPSRNSILEIFLPLFSARHIELKMAVISLALFVFIGFSPRNSRIPDRKMHLFFLADTLGDSSLLHIPSVQDTAFRVQYK